MPAYAAWNATPRGRRSISEAARALGARSAGRARLALLVGAGVDQALGQRPGWTELLSKLGGDLVGQDEGSLRLSDVAGNWPMETAEAVRLTLGPAAYAEKLRETLRPVPPGALTTSALADPISAIVKAGIGVIVSLNYTDDLATALKQLLAPDMKIRVIDRAELSAWPIGDLLYPPPGEVHVLKLHGSMPSPGASSTSGIVLDRSSYDAAQSADAPYRGILGRLFEDFSVVSVGVSWTDVPLRDAAAQARRRLPVARPMHYAARMTNGNAAQDWWEERALTASYGLRPLYYAEHREVGKILKAITNLAQPESYPNVEAPLGQIAAWLDDVGDFESQQQSAWFAAHWEAVSRRVRSVCDAADLAPEDWLAAARIERHLRHFIWFWLDPETRVSHRNGLWEAVARAWDRLPSADAAELWQDERIAAAIDWETPPAARRRDRILLEFALGAYEIYGRDVRAKPAPAPWLARFDRVRECARPHSVAAHRIELASRVWASEASTVLLQAARGAYWEAIEAKVALDIAQRQFHDRAMKLRKTPREWPGGLRDRLWGECDHVRELSRVAGCNRREAGAVVLASLLAPADQAESDLVAAYRRIRDLSGGRPEPTAAWSIVIGLTAVFADQSKRRPSEQLAESLLEWLLDRCGDIPMDTSLRSVVSQNYAPHWSQFHSNAGKLAPLIAARL